VGLGTIYVVEESPDIRQMLGYVLEQNGHIASIFASFDTALDCLAIDPPRLVIVDVAAPGRLTAQEFIAFVRDSSPGTHIIIITADPIVQGKWKVLGADACVMKPFDLEQLLAIIAVLRG